jgi:hypothetical protein
MRSEGFFLLVFLLVSCVPQENPRIRGNNAQGGSNVREETEKKEKKEKEEERKKVEPKPETVVEDESSEDESSRKPKIYIDLIDMTRLVATKMDAAGKNMTKIEFEWFCNMAPGEDLLSKLELPADTDTYELCKGNIADYVAIRIISNISDCLVEFDKKIGELSVDPNGVVESSGTSELIDPNYSIDEIIAKIKTAKVDECASEEIIVQKANIVYTRALAKGSYKVRARACMSDHKCVAGKVVNCGCSKEREYLYHVESGEADDAIKELWVKKNQIEEETRLFTRAHKKKLKKWMQEEEECAKHNKKYKEKMKATKELVAAYQDIPLDFMLLKFDVTDGFSKSDKAFLGAPDAMSSAFTEVQDFFKSVCKKVQDQQDDSGCAVAAMIFAAPYYMFVEGSDPRTAAMQVATKIKDFIDPESSVAKICDFDTSLSLLESGFWTKANKLREFYQNTVRALVKLNAIVLDFTLEKEEEE